MTFLHILSPRWKEFWLLCCFQDISLRSSCVPSSGLTCGNLCPSTAFTVMAEEPQGAAQCRVGVACITLLGCRNQIPPSGWLKQQTFIFSQFWRLGVHHQGISRIGFFQGLSPWLADGRLLPLSSGGLSSVFCLYPDILF